MITAELPLHIIDEYKPLPNSCAKASATIKGATKVSVESHYFIMSEIFGREALEDVDSADNTDGSGFIITIIIISGSSSSADEGSSSSDRE